MEEQEIKYIPYGLDEISQQDFLTNSANNMNNFINLYRWMSKDNNKSRTNKELFIKAVDDISRNITGVTNEGVHWQIQANIDMDNKSPLEREIYNHAAYYLQLQMAQLTPRKKQEEDKSKLIPFNFGNELQNHILKTYYDNNSELMKSPDEGWNSLDARGADGLRGIENRKNRLIEALKSYSNDLQDNKYDFEGTSYNNINDVKSKIQSVLDAFEKTPNDIEDDKKALNALGLSYNGLFSNGGNDIYGVDKDGKQITYSDYARLQQEEEQLKQKLEAEKQKVAKQAAYNNTLFFNKATNSKMLGQNAYALKEKYKDHNTLFAALQGYSQKDIRTLSPQEQSEVQGAYRYLAKDPIDAKLLSLLQSSSSGLYKGAAPNRFRKIKGIDNLVWDSVANLVIQITNRQQQLAILNQPTDLFKNVLTQEEINQQQQLANLKAMNLPINWNDLDEATKNELWAVVNDIGAFVDPEAISGTVMALNAARLRDKNRGEGWSWERVLDWGTSALGGLPIIGDAFSAYKAGANLVKIANASARIGSLVAAAFSAANVPEAWDSIKKIVSKGPTSMTTLDVRNITYGLMGFAAGWKTINSVNARPKAQTTKEHSIEIDGKKVILDEPTVQKVEATHKQSKNTLEASNNIVKMQEVRDAAKKAGIDISETSKVTSGSGILRGNKYSKSIGLAKSPIQTKTVETGNITSGSSNKFWMPKTRSSFLGKTLGTLKTPKNPLRKGIDWFMGRTSEVKSNVELKTSTEISKPQENNSNSSETFNAKDYKINPSLLHNDAGVKNPKPLSESREATKLYREIMNNKFSNNELKSGEVSIGGEKVQVVKQTDGTFNIIHKGNIIGNHRNLVELLKQIRDLIKQGSIKQSSTSKPKISAKEMGETLKKLKAKGWLKQGGLINPSLDNIIEDFIKNNNI